MIVGIFALFILAIATNVSAQSILDCQVFNQSLVPGDFVPLVNTYQSNNSHAEYGNLSNFNYTIACNVTDPAVNLDYGCSGNYYSVIQLYNYTNSHISIDGVYSRDVCFNTSTPGYGFASQTALVGQPTPADYECVFAIFNQSNSHIYECNHTNASLNYFLRLSSGDIIPPTGTIIIHGPNGTYLTGTRNVMLNLTFTDDQAVSECRWANDQESNLATQPWENCTTVKAWILSEPEGNKTVYYEIKDWADNTAVFNDSIIYSYTQDYTPPSLPTVYDGLSQDIDWWNSDNTLHANWFNVSDDISDTINYRYRILENGSCYDNDCNFTDIGTQTEITVNGLTLYENWVYSFDIVAYVFNTTSPIAQSNGTRIDLTKPDQPIINSSSHPIQGTPYAISTVLLNWSATDPLSNGNASGIQGYSFILDKSPGTAPDNIEDDRYWETIKSMSNNGAEQVLKINSTGIAYAVLQQLPGNVTENESVNVKVKLAEMIEDTDDTFSFLIYLIKKSEASTPVGFSHESDAISNIINQTIDIRYAEDMEDARTYEFTLTVNETVDDNSNDIYLIITSSTSDDDNRKNHSIAASTTVNPSTWTWLCNETGGNCVDTTATVDYAIEVKKADSGDEWNTIYPGLADGIYYFHAKAKDNAGNWGDTEHFQINVAAGGVSIAIASPTDGQVFTTDTDEVNISVKAVVSGNATTTIHVNYPDQTSTSFPSATFETTNIFHNITLQLGTNEIYAVANTTAGATTRSSSVYVIVARAERPLTNKTLFIKHGACAVASQAYLCSETDNGARVGMASENPSIVGGGQIVADTSDNTIKIFMSRDFNADDVADDFADNDFLDLETPSFGFRKEAPEFVMQNELRYSDVFISGTTRLEPGKYNLYIIHNGVTPDGKVNLTIEVR